MSKIDCLEALGRDETWYTSADQSLQLLAVVGPGGSHKDMTVTDVLAAPGEKGMGSTKFHALLRAAAKHNRVKMSFNY